MSTYHTGGKALFEKRQLENLPCTVKLSSRGAAEEEDIEADETPPKVLGSSTLRRLNAACTGAGSLRLFSSVLE